MSEGVVTFEVDENVSKPFSPLGHVVTLINLGPGLVWTSTRDNVRVGQGIPLRANASLEWDADKACYARCPAGVTSTLATVDVNINPTSRHR